MKQFSISLQILLSILAMTTFSMAQDINFGDNTSEWAKDGECDDRRFIGTGVTITLDNDDTGHDAQDCKKLYNAGLIKLVDEVAGRAATQCDKIEFGDNSGEWAKDGECDDPRFDGRGTASIIDGDSLLHDASDCAKMCQRGKIWLRVPAK